MKKKKISKEEAVRGETVRFLRSKKIAKGHLSQRKFQLLSELAVCLFGSSQDSESYQHLSKVIVLTLRASESIFLDKIFLSTSCLSENNFPPNMDTLKKIHRLLFHVNSMSKKERCDCLDSERYLLKLRLDKMLGKR
ncbi:MAG: hypothetical protein GF383_14250 [Candidatus Lokiarchaeota archaeon]|nr:hypothetical protein [Candidatus Lokiarchaeota archaeon]